MISFAVLLVGFAIWNGAAARELAPTVVCPTTSSTQMLCLHNYAREVNGLRPLRPLRSLYVGSGIKADKDISCGEFSHTPCGLNFIFSFEQAGVPSGWWGENLAEGYPTIRETFAAWLDSPPHLANIMNPDFKYYGSAFRVDYPFLWCTEFFG